MNSEIQQLHTAYIESMGMDAQDMPLNGSFQRYYFEASKEGVTPDMVRLVIKSRVKFNNGQQDGRYKKPLTLLRLFGDSDAIANVINEAAVIRSQMRVKVVPKEKASVLRMTGRSDEAQTDEPRHVGDIQLIEDLRKAANG
jgi:hypothetical protein